MTSSEYRQSKDIFIDHHLINQNLFCSICLEVFDQPFRLKCGHTFCYACLQYSYQVTHNRICANCKVDYSSRPLEKDFIATNIVNGLKVRCVYMQCPWIGKNQQSKKHHRKCQYKIRKQRNIPTNRVIEINQNEDNSEDVQEIQSDVQKGNLGGVGIISM